MFQQARSEHRKGAALANPRSALEGKLSTDLDAQVPIPHLSETRRWAQQYAGCMLRHFGGPAPAEYLSRHPDEYVVAVRLPLRPADMPRRPDGSVDIEAFPERIFGSEHVKRHPDGSTEYIDIPESKFRELDQRVLHRATCGTLKDHDDQYQMICGTRDELEQIMEEYDKLCPVCLGRPGHQGLPREFTEAGLSNTAQYGSAGQGRGPRDEPSTIGRLLGTLGTSGAGSGRGRG